MKDEIIESMKNSYHLQRSPSLPERDKEMTLLPRGPAEDSEDHKRPSAHHLPSISSDRRVEDTHCSLLSKNALEDDLIRCIFT